MKPVEPERPRPEVWRNPEKATRAELLFMLNHEKLGRKYEIRRTAATNKENLRLQKRVRKAELEAGVLRSRLSFNVTAQRIEELERDLCLAALIAGCVHVAQIALTDELEEPVAP